MGATLFTFASQGVPGIGLLRRDDCALAVLAPRPFPVSKESPMPVRPLMFSRRTAAASLAGALVLGGAGPLAAQPAPRFEPQTQVQGTALLLNGSGTRYKAGLFKVYELGLYTPRKVGTVPELMALAGPKRLQFFALREVSSTELGRLFLKGMGENAPKEKMSKHAASTTRLIEVFSGRPRLMPGDSFAMEFVPGKGTTFYILGQPQGAPVGDDEFFSMVLGIWFGTSPADVQLREALLGSKPAN
jgi:hypothetical protein